MTFRHIYISVPPDQSVPIGGRFSASCIRFYSVPSGGTCFPTNKAYTYELNLLGGVLSMTLKYDPLRMSAYLEQIVLYVKHVMSK